MPQATHGTPNQEGPTDEDNGDLQVEHPNSVPWATTMPLSLPIYLQLLLLLHYACTAVAHTQIVGRPYKAHHN
jgi:hypothetical protein